MKEWKMKYFPFNRTLFFYIGLVVVLCVSALLAHYVQSPYQGDCRVYHINITLETEQETDLELYYDIGKGFNEADRKEMRVVRVHEKVSIDFSVPAWGRFEKIRIDPGQGYVKMNVYKIVISSSDGEVFYNVPLGNIKPVQQIVNAHWNGIYYSFETLPDANDPILLTVKIEGPPINTNQKVFSVYALWLLAGFLVTFFFNWLFRFFILGL
jgi:hypothetical protein